MAVIFGLDFGTSNSALSINFNKKVEVKDIDIYNRNGKILKSVIYYNPNMGKFFIGQEAVNEYIENDAYGRYIQSAKAFLPDTSFVSTQIGNKKFTLEDIIGLILKKIKEKGEEYVGQEVDSVVLGRPVVFSEDQEKEKVAKDRLINAAKISGFKHIHMQYEPVAAALAYESTLKDKDVRIILVADFGGGTSDFAITKIKGGAKDTEIDRKDDVLSLGGVYTGGDTFDSQIMWEKIAKYFGKDVKISAVMSDFVMDMPPLIIGQLRQWHKIPQLRLPKTFEHIKQLKMRADRPDLIANLINLVEDNYGYMLFRAIEKAKIELSSTFETKIVYDDIRIDINDPIDRDEFNWIIKEETNKISECVENVLKNAEIKNDKIDTVFLTGGSSYIPVVRKCFEDKFGKEKIIHENAFTSVGYGLGLHGNGFI